MMFSHDDNIYIAMFFMLIMAGSFSTFVNRKIIVPIVFAMLMLASLAYTEIASRPAVIKKITLDFNAGEEVICKDETNNPLRVTNKEWEARGRLLFKGERGIDMLNNSCESKYSKISTPILVYIFGTLAGISFLLAFAIAMISLNKKR